MVRSETFVVRLDYFTLKKKPQDAQASYKEECFSYFYIKTSGDTQ